MVKTGNRRYCQGYFSSSLLLRTVLSAWSLLNIFYVITNNKQDKCWHWCCPFIQDCLVTSFGFAWEAYLSIYWVWGMILSPSTLSSQLGALFFFFLSSRAFPTKRCSFQICKLPPYYPVSQLQLLKSRVSDSVADYSNLFPVLIVLFSISSGCLNLMIGLLHVF